MAKGFAAQQNALRMRDIMREVARGEIRAMAPSDTIATVFSWDNTTRVVHVFMPGETTTVPVGMGSLRPYSAGQSVRISGSPADRYVSDVLPWDNAGQPLDFLRMGGVIIDGDIILSDPVDADDVDNKIGFHSAPAATPWMVGPALYGQGGWAFFSADANAWQMGFRGSTTEPTRYLWATRAYIGATPNDTEAANGKLVVTGGDLSIMGSNTLEWPTYGGGLNMVDTTWIRVTGSKNFWAAGGIIGCDGSINVNRGGATTSGYKLDVNGAALVNTDLLVNGRATCAFVTISGENLTGASSWTTKQLRIQSQNGGVSTNTAGLTMWVPGAAPQIQVYEGFAEVFQFLNNPASGYVPLWASAFTVSSKRESKVNIRYADDAARENSLDVLRSLRTVTFDDKVLPQQTVPGEKFTDIDARWQAAGRSPLTPRPQDLISRDHDCSVDACGGTAQSPCGIRLRGMNRHGLIVEELHEVFPDAVHCDDQGVPQTYDQAALIALLIESVQVLDTRVRELEAQLSTQ